MVLATALWGATFVVLRDSLTSLAPVPIVFGRFAAAALAFAAWLAGTRRPPDRVAWVGGAIAGALMGGGYLCQAIGLTATSAGSSAFLTCAGTLFAGFFAWPLLGQRPTRTLALGILLAIAGSALLSLRRDFRFGTGELWTLLGALLFALQIVAVARFVPRADPVALTGVQSLAVAVLLLPFAGGAAGQFRVLQAAGWTRFAYLVVAGSVIAPLLQVRAQRVLAAGRVGLLFALEPVFALGFALTLGAERFAPRWWLGAALILCAVSLVEGRAARRDGATPRPASG